ncbi:MAG: hypothetical protein AAB768_04175 [Patescibacteria group bacterium]
MSNFAEYLRPLLYCNLGCLAVATIITFRQIGIQILPDIEQSLKITVKVSEQIENAWKWGFFPVSMSFLCIIYIFGPAIYEHIK